MRYNKNVSLDDKKITYRKANEIHFRTQVCDFTCALDQESFLVWHHESLGIIKVVKVV